MNENLFTLYKWFNEAPYTKHQYIYPYKIIGNQLWYLLLNKRGRVIKVNWMLKSYPYNLTGNFIFKKPKTIPPLLKKFIDSGQWLLYV